MAFYIRTLFGVHHPPNTPNTGQPFVLGVFGLFWGSIPSGYWMGKLLKGKDFDIRAYGSHKTGATNVLRTLGRGAAAVVLVVDLSKGIGPTLLAIFIPLFQGGGWGLPVAGVAALLGHCFPVFIGFKGGRGVLTGAGALLVTSPLSFLISLLTTIGTIALSRFVSLGSILGSVAAIICGIVFFILGWIGLPQMCYMLIAPSLVILFHYDNIGRLLAGKERKLGQKENIASNPANVKA